MAFNAENGNKGINLDPECIALRYIWWTEFRRKRMEELANEICSVQPMPNNIFSDLYKISKSKKELIAEGYRSAEKSGGMDLLWIKEKLNGI